MSNIALTLSFGSPSEAADLFEAIAHAFRTVAARTNAAVGAVTAAAGEVVQAFTEPPKAEAPPVAAAPAPAPAPRARKTKAEAPPAADAPSLPLTSAPAPVAAAPAPVAAAPAPVAAAPAPVAAAPAPVAAAPAPVAAAPGVAVMAAVAKNAYQATVLTIEQLRSHLKAFLEAAEKSSKFGPGKGAIAGAEVIKSFVPAGARPALSTVPVERYADLWAAIDAAALEL